jgi:hypothetical protein
VKSSVGRALFYLELAVCFGPVVIVWLFGVLLFPIWLIMIIGYFTGLIPFDEPEGILPWRVLWPMVMVVGGGIGMFGLMRAIWLAEQDAPKPGWSKTTLLAMLVGVGGLAFFNLYSSSISFYEGLLLLVLPCVGAIHLVFLARHSLLKGLVSSALDDRSTQ